MMLIILINNSILISPDLMPITVRKGDGHSHMVVGVGIYFETTFFSGTRNQGIIFSEQQFEAI